MNQEKKEKGDLPALKVAWIHFYNNFRTTLKRKKRVTNYSNRSHNIRKK